VFRGIWGPLLYSVEVVDLDVGTALFPRVKDVRRWNDACIDQIEGRCKDTCEAVDVHGYDWRDGPKRHKTATAPTRMLGIQTPEVLRLRTHPDHRMRVMLLYNQDVQHGWANGTRARLLARNSWTGKTTCLRKGLKLPWRAQKIEISDVAYADFNVRVVKDEETTLGKKVRFDDAYLQCSPARSDEGVARWNAWRQVQLMAANALTGHRAQGLTTYVTYIALTMVYGFRPPVHNVHPNALPLQHVVCPLAAVRHPAKAAG